MSYRFGRLIRVLNTCTDQAMTNALAAMELTGAQGRLMGYIAHSNTPPCAKDIEEAFQLSHPTVSGILSRLEQKDFIELKPDPQDRRCKRIYIRPKGLELNEMMHEAIRSMEEKIVQNFSEEEKEQFASLLRRAIDNMGGNPCKRKHKEEPKE